MSTDTSRRRFLAGGALLGMGLFAGRAGASEGASPAPEGSAVLNSSRPDAEYDLAKPENMLRSVCLQCNTGCGITCKLQDGVVSKIDGNPYSPWTMLPHLDYETPLDAASVVDGALCPKGQSGLQTAYDPYRLRKVLKRAGARGEGKWISVPFAQAVREIAEGGRIFAHVPGEEQREVEGLAALTPLKDPAIAEAMARDVKAIWAAETPAEKTALVERFKLDHADHLDVLIDPDHPDLGPKNNQVVLNWGRVKGGRGDFYRRFAAALGTTNAHGHTTVCQGSLYFTCAAISDQYRDGSFSGGRKFYWQADTENAKFVLFVGANLFDGNYGPPNRSVRLTEGLASGRTRIACADPRFSKLASKSWKWLPLQPGTDIALAMAMIRWILDNQRHDQRFLAAANQAAATAAGEKSWSNASWLVRIGADGKPADFVRATELGLGKEHDLLVLVGGVPTAVDPNDRATPLNGDLLVDTSLPGGIRVKSSLQLLWDSSHGHSIEEWAEQTAVPVADIIAVARELTSHGKAVGVDIHRGPAQHTNGFYAVFAWMSLNMLLGNFDHKGGMIKDGGAFDTMGRGGRFGLRAHPGAIPRFGISSIRHGVDYEKTTLFSGYPAKRNWYPLASDVFQEVIPSIGDAYPYPVKCLITYMSANTYALPAGHTNIDTLCDVQKLPLYIANDIVVGMTSMYADYIFPDASFLERWEFHGMHFMMTNRAQPVRQPVIAPLTADCQVYGQTMPITFESMMLGLAERLDLPGFGNHAFGPGLHFKHQDDLYIRAVGNLAFGEQADGSASVPDADAREMELFIRARRHLPKHTFALERWRALVGEKLWPKVVYVLNRGGRFENHDQAFVGGTMRHAYAKLLNMYQERTAATIHAVTGKPFPGIAIEMPIQDLRGNTPESDGARYPLKMITHRTVSQCKSRTITNPWLTPLMPDNGILICPRDAAAQGLRDGQKVRVSSITNPQGGFALNSRRRVEMIGTLKVTQTVRPGVISFALGFGHWATGAADVEVDGYVIRGEPRRAAGIHANAAMWTDAHTPNTCLSDPIGGSVSFYDTMVRLEAV